nr:hypothetical protein [Tanacetum cinerariifolium]
HTYAERQKENKRKTDKNQQQQPHKKQNVARAYTAGPGEKKVNTNNNNSINQKAGACYECDNTKHIKRNCPKLKNRGNGNGNGVAQRRAYALGGRDATPDSNVITGTFFLNNSYVKILFDTGADRSCISTTFTALINITPTTLENHYDVELADGKIIRVSTIILGCTLYFMNHPFYIDLMPVPLGSFDVIIGMDWLTKYHGLIICDEKIVRVPFGREMLIFHGNKDNQREESRLNIISCTKAQEYLSKGTLKKKLTDKYCSKELTLMCTKFLADEIKKVDKYISGLPYNIYENVMSARPKTLDDAIELANDLMDQKLRTYAEKKNDNKRKADDSSRNNQQQQPHKKQNVALAYTVGPGEKKAYIGNLPLCTKCNYHHIRQCAPKCENCKRDGHTTSGCRVNTNNNNNKNQKARACYECGGRDASPDSNAITGTFLLNNRYASILFDTGADRSFVSTTFSALINITPATLENHCDVELAIGKIIRVNTIIQGVIIYDENIIHVPFEREMLFFKGDGNNQREESRLNIIPCTKAKKYLSKGCDVFLAHITTKGAKDKSKWKRLEDVPIVKDFLEVFPKDFSGIPPARQVEFQIDLVLGAAPIAQAPYRLAPFEMKELAKQLQELSDKGFIRPNSSP